MHHLLVVDLEGNLVLADAVDGIRVPIGARMSADQRSWVTTAVWSHHGQWTAWTVDSADPEGIRQIRVHDESNDLERVLIDPARAFYLYPSPNGRWLSHISPGPLGLELALTDIVSGEMNVIERGQPLYWAWSPDGTELALHVDDRVLVTDPTGTRQRVLCEDAGRFLAPWWLPGGSLIYSRDDCIVATGTDGVDNIIAETPTGRFMLDPDMRRIAYVTHDSRLVVHDLLMRTTDEITQSALAGFFWSPDGRRLAALELVGNGSLRWLVYDSGVTTLLPPFRPSRMWASSVLPFFEQYALSHTHWSPDGTRLVAPAVDDDGTSGAVVHTVDAPPDGSGTKWIPDADLVWWA